MKKGYKQSGSGESDHRQQARDQYTDLKAIWIDLTDALAGNRIS